MTPPAPLDRRHFARALRGIVAAQREEWPRPGVLSFLLLPGRRHLRPFRARETALALATSADDARVTIAEVVERWRAGEPCDLKSDLQREVTALLVRLGNPWAFKKLGVPGPREGACGLAAPLEIGLDPGLWEMLVAPPDFEGLEAWLERNGPRIKAFTAYAMRRRPRLF